MEYQTLKELRQDWKTVRDLFVFLKEHGYSANLSSLKRWEKKEIIPEPRRITLRKRPWRVYHKDGTDFNIILKMLERRTKKVIRL